MFFQLKIRLAYYTICDDVMEVKGQRYAQDFCVLSLYFDLLLSFGYKSVPSTPKQNLVCFDLIDIIDVPGRNYSNEYFNHVAQHLQASRSSCLQVHHMDRWGGAPTLKSCFLPISSQFRSLAVQLVEKAGNGSVLRQGLLETVRHVHMEFTYNLTNYHYDRVIPVLCPPQ